MKNIKLSIIGLGYVGLPIAIEFGKIRATLGFDINEKRITELKNQYDSTQEIKKNQFQESKKLVFVNSLKEIADCNFFIVAVPTPIYQNKEPDLRFLINSSKGIGSILKKGDIVVYESTVYPGATEEICVPILENCSKLKFNKDFFVGYSPERINPGDKAHTIKNIIKVVAGSTPKTTNVISNLYASIVKAGTYKVSSIKTAEAAKIIENTQRDLNIALVNELSIIFQKLNLDTEEVLKAAETKWNFNSFRPGLVGGHCIGVDPYYLTFKSKTVGHYPKVILSGRKVNDDMSKHVCNNITNIFKKRKVKNNKAKVLIMGLSFKENCSDTRNSKVLDVCKFLLKKKIKVEAYDPAINKAEAELKFLNLITYPKKNHYDCVLIAVKHNIFVKMKSKTIKSFCNNSGFIYDLKYMLKEKKDYFRL